MFVNKITKVDDGEDSSDSEFECGYRKQVQKY